MPPKLKLAIIGDPVNHSLSPSMHMAALRKCGLEGSYEKIRVGVCELAHQVEALRGSEFTGFNVTAPHKERIIPLLDRIDRAARRIGAVNTVVREGGTFTGFNTDAIGLGRILDRVQTKDKRVLVLGAGGAARACVDTLLDCGWQVAVANRTIERAWTALQGKAEVMGLIPPGPLAKTLRAADLLINATSCGFQANESPLPGSLLLDSGPLTVMDLVYSPLRTRLLEDAGSASCRVIDGLALLTAQAADSFQLWSGRRLPDVFFREAAMGAGHGVLDWVGSSNTPPLIEAAAQ